MIRSDAPIRSYVRETVVGTGEAGRRSGRRCGTVPDGSRCHAGVWLDAAVAASAPSTLATAHGGQETTLTGLYTSLMHFGGIIVPPGYTDPLKFADGNPYGVGHVTGPNNQNELSDATIAALDHMATRVVTTAAKLSN